MRVEYDHRATNGETICPYCGVGCRLWAEMAYGRVLRVKGVADAPANRGGICAKGATLDQTLVAADRAVQPMVRKGHQRELRPVSWESALDEIAGRFADIISRHGPDAIAFYGSGQLDTQAVYATVKLFKGYLGTNNTDSNSRLCMATAVAAYRASFGSDGPPCCYDDIEHADVILIAGSNMAEAHPVTFDRIKAARKARPELRIVVVDPRRTATADAADHHVAVKAGGDTALFNALGKLLLESGAADDRFIHRSTSGFLGYRQQLEAADLDELAEGAGVSTADLLKLAQVFAGKRWLSFYCMGLGQSTVGMWKLNSLINLHLLTGTVGKPGCGPFSLTGQPNAMGGREMGLLAHQLPGYRFVENAEHRQEVEQYWDLPAGSIAVQPGLTAIEMFRALERGRLKAIWIAATNPLVTLPDLHQVRRALGAAELVVVQDAFHPTETSQVADVVLPAASWAERDWMSTNSERMVSYSQKLVEPPGAALPDWQIACKVAQRLGFSGFDFRSAAEIWDECIGLTAGRVCDMSGMPHQRLVAERHLQWPCSDPAHAGTRRLYTDGCFQHDDGRARFHYRPATLPKEPTDHEFPLVLTTGRLYSHWHTLTRTAKVKQLTRRDPEPFAEIHPRLAEEVDVVDGQWVQISSRRGTVRLKARLSDRVPQGVVFVPMHWGDLHQPDSAVNYLTLAAIGRVAKQPEFKHCAVSLEKVTGQGERPDAESPAQTTHREPRLQPALSGRSHR